MTDLANITTKFVFRLRVHQRERALSRRRKLIYKGLVLALGTAAMAPVAGAQGRGTIALSPATSRIVASEENRTLAEALAKNVVTAAAVRIPVISDEGVEESIWRHYDLILIGNLNDNQETARLYYDYKAFLDAVFPGKGGLMVKTLVDPLGYGKNVVLVGGSDARGTQEAMQRFSSLVSVHGAKLPSLHAVVSKALPGPAPAAEEVEEILKENRRNFESGKGRSSLNNAISYGLNFHFTADPVWARLFKSTLLDYVDLAHREGEWDFDPNISVYFRYSNLLNIWDLIEDDEEFTPERGTIEKAFWEMASYISTTSYMMPSTNPPGEPRQNHTTFALLSLEAATRYFGRRGYEEVSQWKALTEELFGSQLRTYRSDDDAADYTWLVPMQTFNYYQRQGSERARRKGFLDQVADLAIVVTDNRRDEVTFGDILDYTPWERIDWPSTATVLSRAVWAHRDPGQQWAYRWLTQGKTVPLGSQVYAVNIGAAEPRRLLGISAMLLDGPPLAWVAARVMQPSWLPRQGLDYVDKLSLRASFDPADEYVLLDGTAAFTHGHKDANSILRLTWLDRIWLADLDYVHQLPRYHNSIDVAREGQTGVLPPLAQLSVGSDLGQVGFVRSVLPDYNGVDWSRNLIWRKGRYVAVIDELQARQSGNYDLRCYWRTLGEVRLQGRILQVEQPGAYFRVANGDGSALSMTKVDPLLEKSSQLGNWSAYPYADNVVRVLVERQDVSLSPGQSSYFVNLLYARAEDQESDLVLKPLMGGVALLEGEGEAVFVGVARRPRQLGSVRVQAALFELSSQSLFAAQLTEVRSPQGWLMADPPVNIAIEAPGQGRVIADAPTVIRFNGMWSVDSGTASRHRNRAVQTVKLTAGEHKISLNTPFFTANEFRVLRARARPFQVAAAPAPVSFGIKREWSKQIGAEVTVLQEHQAGGWVLGLRDGRVLRLQPGGRTQTVAQMGGEIRALVALDGGELVVGDREGTVTAVGGDGEVRWRHQFDTYWDYPERVTCMARQFTGSGDRLLVGTEGSRVHAFDLQGKLQWSTPATVRTGSSSRGRAVEWWGALTDLQTADFDGDESEEIVVGTEYQTPIAVLESEGQLKWLTWGWVCCESRAYIPYVGTSARTIEVAELVGGTELSIVYGTETDEVYALSPAGQPRWSTNVGGEVNGLVIRDLDGDGRKEVMAAAGSGYLTVLDHAGKRLWWRQHPGGLTALAVSTVEATKNPVIAVGSTTGRLYVYDQQGHLLATADVKGTISQLHLQGNEWGSLLTASTQGEVSHWRVLPQRKFSRSSRHHY